jgi:hypothetical protein
VARLPFPFAYWVRKPLFLAGPFPGHPSREIARQQLHALLECGVRTFIDLMQEEPRMGAPPYAPVLHELAQEQGLDCSIHRFEIEDCATPSRATMREIQDTIDVAITARRTPYVHCWGGRGRTGTVVGVHLLRCGLATPENFVEVLARLRAGAPGASPETAEQIAFVRTWQG